MLRIGKKANFMEIELIKGDITKIKQMPSLTQPTLPYWAVAE
jgi:hypothetical protein